MEILIHLYLCFCETIELRKQHIKNLRHTIDYRADQFTLSRFEIHSNTCHERKPDKTPANFRLQPIARRMRLQYIYHDQSTEQHPFHTWNPVGFHRFNGQLLLRSYLEEVKIKLAELHWKIWKADVSSVSPSSERRGAPDEGLTLVSFPNLSRWLFDLYQLVW